MKLKIKKWLSVLCACCVLVTSAACSTTTDDIALVDLGNEVSLHTRRQTEFLTRDDYSAFTSWSAEDGSEEASRPEPVHFSWDVTASWEDSVEKYVLEISEWHNFLQSVKYETTESELDVYNLRLATHYFWRVTAELSYGGKKVSQASSFQTEDMAPRNLYVDGITNVRDLGGWATVYGEYVKQGMIYRCGRFNVSQIDTIEPEITQQGIDTMRNELGVRTEIDLRMAEDHSGCLHGVETSGITYSLLGEDINYYNVSMEWIMGNDFDFLSDPQFYDAIKEFFTYLSDESNYPIAFHCNIGTDRTGLFAFLINALLGVSEDDLYRDYLFSNFGDIGTARTTANIKSYAATIKSYEGDTFAEQTENCLLDIGVRQEDIDALRYIMVE